MENEKRIYYHNTDCGGVVYYAEYLKFLEEGRTLYLEEKGISVKELMDHDIFFVIARQEIDYKLPAFYGDILQIDTRITNISRARIDFEYEIRNQNNKTVAFSKTVLVCIDKNFKPMPIPEEVRTKLI